MSKETIIPDAQKRQQLRERRQELIESLEENKRVRDRLLKLLAETEIALGIITETPEAI